MPATRVVLGTKQTDGEQYSQHACHCRVAECAALLADRPTSLYDMTDAANLSECA